VLQKDPEFFTRWAIQQKPQYMWLGCSDSRVVAEAATGLDMGEVFVHRNVGNVLSHADNNAMSALEYSVKVCDHCQGSCASPDSDLLGWPAALRLSRVMWHDTSPGLVWCACACASRMMASINGLLNSSVLGQTETPLLGMVSVPHAVHVGLALFSGRRMLHKCFYL
jgi:hypothetical protein